MRAEVRVAPLNTPSRSVVKGSMGRTFEKLDWTKGSWSLQEDAGLSPPPKYLFIFIIYSAVPDLSCHM